MEALILIQDTESQLSMLVCFLFLGKAQTKTKCEKKKVYLKLQFAIPLPEKSRQKYKQEPRCKYQSRNFFSILCSVWFLIYPKHLLRSATAHIGLDLSIWVKKMPHGHAHRPVCWRQFFSCGSFFPDDSALYLTKINNNNI